MSECREDSSDAHNEDTESYPAQPGAGHAEDVGRASRGYSTTMFLKKGKPKKQLSRTNPLNTSKDAKEKAKKLPLDVGTIPKKYEVMAFEEVCNDFTCSSSIMESYQLNTNKESKYCFRKLEDGTFAMEKKNQDELNPEKNESGNKKRNTKLCHQKGRYAYRPLKICFKKRSKALRKHSDSNDDHKTENKSLGKSEANVPNAETQSEGSSQDKSIGNTWATFKRLVTRKKKLHSSVKRRSQLNCRHVETNPSNTYIQCVSKKKRFSHLRIPCMNFSKGKRSGHVNVQTDDTLGIIKPMNPPSDDDDDERGDKALAIKYKLQRSIDAENGISVGDVDHDVHNFRSMNQQTQNRDTIIEKEQIQRQDINEGVISESDHCMEQVRSDNNCTNMSQSPVQGHALLCHRMERSEDKCNGQPAYEMNGDQSPQEIYNKNSHIHNLIASNDGFNKASLLSHLTNTAPLLTDPYEILLMGTAASLVNKVIESSIQQLVDEGAFHN